MNKDRDLAVKYTKDLSFVYRYVLLMINKIQ